jgi:DNA-binding IclR family transcriptional regulator
LADVTIAVAGKRSGTPAALKTVDKAFRVLLHLGAARRPLGLGEIARGVGLHVSTTHRILSVLTRHGFAQSGAARGQYLLGVRLIEFGHLALDTSELRAKARPILEQLASSTRETVHLMIPDGNAGLYIDRVESSQRVRVASSVGHRELLHCSGVGKAILASLSSDRREAIIARGLPRLTPRTITDRRALRRHLEVVARRGFAIDNEEGEIGIRCVGAPVFDHHGNVMASISVAGPAYRLPLETLTRLAPRVRDAAGAVSSALGYPGRLS